MGSLFGSKSNTTTTKTEIPEWVEDIQKDYGADQEFIRDEALRMYYEGGTARLPGMPSEWQDAEDIIRGTGTDALAGMGEARDGTGYAMGGVNDAMGMTGQIYDNLAGVYDRTGGNYESQYTDDIVDTTLAGMQRQAQREQLAREGQAAAVGGTSNSRTAVGNAVANQLTGMNMAEMEAQLRDDAFRFGTDASFREREGYTGTEAMRGNLAGQYGDLSNTYGSLAGQYGDISQGIGGFGMQLGGAIGSIGDKYFDYDAAKAAEDQDALSWLGAMYGGANPSGVGAGMGSTSTESPKPSTFSQILGAGTSIASIAAMSDENVKDFSESAGLLETPQGALDTVSSMPDMERYSYKDGYGHRKGEHSGLRAQDIEKVNPDLVIDVNGVKHVDSFLMMNTVLQAVKELDARTRRD